MSWAATQQELEQYERDGYFAREAVFNQEELEPLCDAVEGVHRAVEAAAARGGAAEAERVDGKRYQKLLDSSVQWEWRADAQEIRSMEPYHHLDPRLDALSDDARLWEATRAIVGSHEVSLFSDKLNFKRPGGAPFPWHQDSPYWNFGCDHVDRLVSILVTLDAANVENGCLWVVPGSHKSGAIPCYQDRGVQGRLYTDVESYGGADPVPLDVAAGSVVFFHGDIIHGSQSNRTDECRRALVLTYQPAGFPRWQHEDVRAIPASAR
jgi:phytanoyl-CoA hydroxylase